MYLIEISSPLKEIIVYGVAVFVFIGFIIGFFAIFWIENDSKRFEEKMRRRFGDDIVDSGVGTSSDIF